MLITQQNTSIYQLTVVYSKLFKVEKFPSCKIKLSFAGKKSWLDGSLVWPKSIAQTGKVLRLPIDPQKP